MCVFLEDLYTTVERTLIDAGHEETVRNTRFIFQQTRRGRFETAVEELTQREVIAFFSQVHIGPDMALEGFVLRPEADAGQTANGAGGAHGAGSTNGASTNGATS